MPYKSDAQTRSAHTPAGPKALGGPEKVKEWDQASKGKDLPMKKYADGGAVNGMWNPPIDHPSRRLRDLTKDEEAEEATERASSTINALRGDQFGSGVSFAKGGL